MCDPVYTQALYRLLLVSEFWGSNRESDRKTKFHENLPVLDFKIPHSVYNNV